ncbi:MAG: ribosome-associated translation inhibitor RaiA [Rhodocyclaceae bacterium]|nr:ribosome-associated translation inhibitor RaiA [Rhodocyclaceae bacterium]
MNLNITGHHVEITPAIREYVNTKIDRVIRHFDNVTSVNVILSVEKLVQKSEVTVHVRGKDLFAESQDEDMYAAIDAMTDKLDRQVIKYKQKMQGHGHDALKHQSIET